MTCLCVLGLWDLSLTNEGRVEEKETWSPACKGKAALLLLDTYINAPWPQRYWLSKERRFKILFSQCYISWWRSRMLRYGHMRLLKEQKISPKKMVSKIPAHHTSPLCPGVHKPSRSFMDRRWVIFHSVQVTRLNSDNMKCFFFSFLS